MKIINNNKKSKNSSIQFFFFTKTCTLHIFVIESIFACMKFMHQNSCFCGGITQVLIKKWGGEHFFLSSPVT